MTAIAAPRPGPRCAYFFDIDGTLVDLAGSPSAVRVGAGLPPLIEALVRETGGAVALISGRSLADIDRLFPGQLPAAGQHGVERRTATGVVHRHQLPTAPLNRVRRRLASFVAAHPPLLLEDKGESLALHYRGAPRLADAAHRVMRAMRATAGRQYVLQPGKRVIELKPAGRNKGAAIREFMREAPFLGRTPVFIGDDATDEAGFAVVNRLRGCAIKVGAGRTAARWRLPHTRAVASWLRNGRPAPAAVTQSTSIQRGAAAKAARIRPT